MLIVSKATSTCDTILLVPPFFRCFFANLMIAHKVKEGDTLFVTWKTKSRG